MKSLRKQANAAPKYVLHHPLGYLSNKQGLSGVNFCYKIADAMEYAVGFDNPADKIGIWNATLKVRQISGEFKAVNI